jgi:hypothetical protein
MLAKFFHKSEPISLISLVLLLAVWVFYYQFSIAHIPFNLSSLGMALGVFMFFIFILVLYDFLFQKYRLTLANHYAIFVLIVLIGVFPEVLHVSNITISNVLIILSFRKLLSLRKKDNLLSKLFDSGFLIGISYLVYPNSIIFLILIYLGYFVYLKIIDKRLLIPLIGFVTPLFLTFTYLLFFDKIGQFKTLTEFNFNITFTWFNQWHFSIPFMILGFVLLILIFKYASVNVFSDLEEERNYKLVIAQLLIGTLLLVLNGTEIKDSIILIFFPAAILVGNSLKSIKREWLQELLLYLLLFLALFLFFFV